MRQATGEHDSIRKNSIKPILNPNKQIPLGQHNPAKLVIAANLHVATARFARLLHKLINFTLILENPYLLRIIPSLIIKASVISNILQKPQDPANKIHFFGGFNGTYEIG